MSGAAGTTGAGERYHPGVRQIREEKASGEVPLWTHPEWSERFPWLIQGTTGAGSGAEPFDLGLSGHAPVGEVLSRWRQVREATGAGVVVHARQAHGTRCQVHRGISAPGILVMEGVDGHLSDVGGVLMTVSVADCVPVSLVDPLRRTVALLHSGWKGTAGGITEHAITLLGEEYGSLAEDLWLHCGPAICGPCYEVGPQVHAAILPERPPPSSPSPIDLRAAITARAARLGVLPERITLSAHCTRCGEGEFFSHRGGSAARQMGVLGVVAAGA